MCHSSAVISFSDLDDRENIFRRRDGVFSSFRFDGEVDKTVAVVWACVRPVPTVEMGERSEGDEGEERSEDEDEAVEIADVVVESVLERDNILRKPIVID
jgi:hypothetical protein